METERPVAPLIPDKKPEPVDFRENKLALWRSPEAPPPIGAALENLGNTCFLNAVLQCVAHTVPLLQSLQSPPHPYPCAGDRGAFSGEEPRFCSLCALRQHIDVCMHGGANVVKPCGFVNNLSNISSSFSRYQQEDAHEFLHCLLDHLHTSCLGPRPSDSASSLQKTSLIKGTFGGRLKSQVQCCDCGHRSDTYEPLLDLSLEIEDAGSLEEALGSFTKVERIEDPEIKLTCEGCRARVSVQKQFTLEQAPPVVALHLKRFKSNGYFADKIDKFVKYPTELDLRPFHSNPGAEGEELRYDLYAAVMHQGCSSLYGHYYCFIRPAPDSWFIMDDEKVYRVDEESALSQSAYILFYVKRGTPWFSGFVEAGGMGGGGGCPDAGGRTSPVSVVDHVEADQSSSSSDGEDRGGAAGADGGGAPPEAAGGRSWACGGADDEAHCQRAGPSDCLRSGASPAPCEGSDGLPETEDGEKVDGGGGGGGCRISPPCTPRQSRGDKFYDEPWEDGKEEQPAKAQSQGKAERSTGREMVAAGSYLRSMPRSRRLRLEQLMGRAPSSSAPHEQKRKKPKLLQLQAESSPPLPSSLLHKLIHAQEDASDLVVSIDSAVRGEMSH